MNDKNFIKASCIGKNVLAQKEYLHSISTRWSYAAENVSV